MFFSSSEDFKFWFLFSEIVIAGNVSNIVLSPGCPIKYNWCKTTPKIRPIQFAIGIFLAFVGFAMPQIIINLLYSKIIGPRKQVRRNYICLILYITNKRVLYDQHELAT